MIPRLRDQFIDRFSRLDSLPPLNRIRHAFALLEQDTRRTDFCGCPFIKVAKELAERTHPVMAIVADYKTARQKWFERSLRAANVRNPKEVAEQLMIIWDGALIRAEVADKRAVAHAARRIVALLLPPEMMSGKLLGQRRADLLSLKVLPRCCPECAAEHSDEAAGIFVADGKGDIANRHTGGKHFQRMHEPQALRPRAGTETRFGFEDAL